MKKILVIMMLFITCFSLSACSKKQTDALKFKEEYESLNNTTREKDGKKIRSIDIDENNPFIYKDAEDIVSAIKDEESFVVYFGFNDCPWCRSVVPTLIEVCKDLKIKKVYYVDVKEIRDTMELNEEGKLVTTKKGSDAYYELTNLLKDVLNDYVIYNGDEEINTNAKRIYAPNIVKIEKGKAIGLTEGISDKQTDGYMTLTSEMKKDSYNKINELLKK